MVHRCGSFKLLQKDTVNTSMYASISHPCEMRLLKKLKGTTLQNNKLLIQSLLYPANNPLGIGRPRHTIHFPAIFEQYQAGDAADIKLHG